MRRKLFTFTSLLSLVLFVVTVVMWVRSHTTFDDLDNISTSRTSGDYTQDYIRLGSTMGRFIVTRRDIVWPSYNPSFSYVTSTWDGANGAHVTHTPPVDLNSELDRPKLPNERSWELRFGGIRFKRLIHDATPTNTKSRMIGVVIIIPHAYVAALLAILPVIALLKWWRRPGREGCKNCGYSLTGNISGVCPECGTPIALKAVT